MPRTEVPVLIVGGGPTGLSASLLLSRHGVRSLLVERRPGTSMHPKARGLNVRTLELFRVWGIEAAVRAAAGELDRAVDIVWAPTMLDPEARRIPYGGAGERLATDSPTTSTHCPQEKLEPVLLDAARACGIGQLRFCHELRGLEQDEGGVTAIVVDRASGKEQTIRSEWLIAADGAQSSVRSMLGISMTGPGPLFHRMGIYFRAALREIAARRPAFMYIVSPPGGGGPLGPVDPVNNLWFYMAPYRPENERAEDFTVERCIELVRGAVGDEDLEVEVLSAEPWSGAAATANRFRAGRVFLAGDAAHLIPPTGGQAMNVGIQDVHNLAWKLGAHAHAWAGAALLETFEAERRPLAIAVTGDASQNVSAGSNAPRLEHFSNRGRVLGLSYDSSAVLPDGTALPAVANRVVEYVPTARPGSRAPHLWLQCDNRQISTLDLFDTHFVLLTGPADTEWCSAGNQIAARFGIPLRCYRVGPDGPLIETAGAWPSLYGVEPDGAVLVRPDGHVAWRSQTSDPNAVCRLAEAFSRILSLDLCR